MSRPWAAVVAAALAAGVLSSPVSAASLLRKGQKAAITGEITKISKTEVTIKPKTKDAENVPVNEISRLRFDGEPPKLNVARGYEEKGNLTLALENYNTALADASDANLKADVEYLIARTTARMALGDPAKLDDAAKKLEAWRKANPDSFRFYESLDFLAQIHLAKGDFDKAKETFTQMEQAPWGDFKMAAKSGNARVLLKQEQFAPALTIFDEVIGMPGKGPAETSRRHDAMIGKVTCLMQQQQYADAVKVLDEVIQKVSPDDQRIQAEAYVRQGDCLQQQGKQKEALIAYLHVDVLFSGETALHAESLFHLSKLWNAAGQPGRAADAAAELQKEYPNSPWTKKLGGAAE